MPDERTYSTREVAQMWNVSESTVKRWADTSGLHCYRTPGGHRKFRLEDLSEFQARRSFEATGFLTSEEWEDPNLEIWLNSKNFGKVRELLLYLGSQNQRSKVRSLLERLYLRGMRLEEIYDEVLVPLCRLMRESQNSGELSPGQALLTCNNLEEAFHRLSPKIVRRRRTGKTALCAAPFPSCRIDVNVLSVLLEIEGWDSLNLGEDVPFDIVSQMVEIEPINLVCIFYPQFFESTDLTNDCDSLNAITATYRIPVILTCPDSDFVPPESLDYAETFSDLRSLRSYLARLFF
jgi:excisionase family DNA binding protein